MGGLVMVHGPVLPVRDPFLDRELLERFAAGDERAFAALLRRHGPMVLGICRRILHNEADAEDAFQATFLTLLRKAGSLRCDSLAGWLHVVARHVARPRKRHELRRLGRE